MDAIYEAPCFTLPSEVSLPDNGGNWATRLLRAAILCVLFSIILLQEYFQASVGPIASSLYAKEMGEFRAIDLLVFVLVAAHIAALACSRRPINAIPRSVLLPAFGFFCSVAFAFFRGVISGGINLFFDWRALALGFGLYFVFLFWMRTPSDLSSALLLFGVVTGFRLVGIYCQFLAGGGEILQGLRIPIYDGPTISAFVFTALFALVSYNSGGRGLRRILMLVLSAAASLMVILCFRRTYWIELTLGAAILIFLQKGHRVSALLKCVAVVGAAAVVLGPPLYSRLQSFDVFQTSSQFSDDNGDHIDDLLDAWDQVQESPFLGVGLGSRYPTWRIRNWKRESVMVHNAPLHVWLKYGLCGLIFYLWFHAALFRWLKRGASADSGRMGFSTAALAFLAAQFIVSLTFAPWPFSELQSTTLISFLLAGSSLSRTV